MTTRDILVKGRALYASSPSHTAVGAWPDLGTYCVTTALDAAASGRNWHAYCAFRAAVGGESPITYNATHTTDEVLTAFDRAIQKESA